MERNLRYDPLYQNYVTVIHGFAYVGKVLEPYTRAGLRKVHQDINKDCAGLPPCVGRCSENFGRDVSKWCNMCSKWRENLKKRLRKQRARHVKWESTESWRWSADWESIVDVFLSPTWGKSDTKLDDIGTATHIWSNCKEFNVGKPLLSDIKELRNNHFAHNPDMKVDDVDSTKVFASLESLLKAVAGPANINLAACIQDLKEIKKGDELIDVLNVIEDKLEMLTEKIDANATRQTIVSACLANLVIAAGRRGHGEIVQRLTVARRREARSWVQWKRLSLLSTIVVTTMFLFAIIEVVKHPQHTACVSEMYSYPFEQDFELLPYLQEHTSLIGRQWLLDDIEAKLNQMKAPVKGLLLTADMGYGKSAVVRHLLCSRENEKGNVITKKVVAYHICRFDDPSTKDPQRFVYRIVGFLSTKFPEFGELISLLPKGSILYDSEKCRKEMVACFEQGILRPLQNLQNTNMDHMIIIVDALDECYDEHKNKNYIFELFKERIRKIPNWLKIIVTSRNNSFINDISMSNFHKIHLHAHDQRNVADIKEFLRVKTKSYIKLITDKGCNLLFKRSEDNFLFAIHAVEYLLRNNDTSIYIPESLSEIYELNFRRHFASSEEFGNAKQIIQLVLASLHPLSKRTAGKILSGNNISHAEFMKSFEKLSFCFRSYDEITFVHKSLEEWITSSKNQHFGVSVEQGHAVLSRYLLTQVNLTKADVVDIAIHLDKSNDTHWAKLFEGAVSSFNVTNSVLHRLIWRSNSTEALKVLFELHVDVDALNEGNVTPAFVAASKGNLNQLIFLHSKGANLYFIVKDEYCINSEKEIDEIKNSLYFGYGLIHIAIQYGHFHVVDYLVKQNTSVLNVTNGLGLFPCEIACENGHLELLKLIAMHSQISASCLYYASSEGHTDIIEWLHERGLNASCISEAESSNAFMLLLILDDSKAFYPPSAVTHSNNITYNIFDLWWVVRRSTPLHAAIRAGLAETVSVLVTYYPNLLDCTDAFGMTPFLLCVAFNKTHIFEQLTERVFIDKCANSSYLFEIDRVTYTYRSDHLYGCPYGAGYLHLDAIYGRGHMTKLLTSRGINMNWSMRDNQSITPVHYAACRGNKLFLKTMMETKKYSIADIKTSNGSSPFHSASICGSVISMRIMSESFSKPLANVYDVNKRSILHYIVLRNFSGNPAKYDKPEQINSLNTLKAIIKQSNIILTETDSLSRNILHYALQNGHYLIIDYVRETFKSEFTAMLQQRDVYGERPLKYAVKALPSSSEPLHQPLNCSVYTMFDRQCGSGDHLYEYLSSYELGLIQVLQTKQYKIETDVSVLLMESLGKGAYLTTACFEYFENISIDLTMLHGRFVDILKQKDSHFSILSLARKRPRLFSVCGVPLSRSLFKLIAYTADYADEVYDSLISSIYGKPVNIRRLSCSDANGYNSFHYALLSRNIRLISKLFDIGVSVISKTVTIKQIPHMLMLHEKDLDLISNCPHDYWLCVTMPDMFLDKFFNRFYEYFSPSDICLDRYTGLSIVHIVAANRFGITLNGLIMRFGKEIIHCSNRNGITPPYLWNLLGKWSTISVFDIPKEQIMPQPHTEDAMLVYVLSAVIGSFPHRRMTCLFNNDRGLKLVKCLRQIPKLMPKAHEAIYKSTKFSTELIASLVYGHFSTRQMLFSEKTRTENIIRAMCIIAKELRKHNSHFVYEYYTFRYFDIMGCDALFIIRYCTFSSHKCKLAFRHKLFNEFDHLLHVYINFYKFLILKFDLLLVLDRYKYIPLLSRTDSVFTTTSLQRLKQKVDKLSFMRRKALFDSLFSHAYLRYISTTQIHKKFKMEIANSESECMKASPVTSDNYRLSYIYSRKLSSFSKPFEDIFKHNASSYPDES